MRSRIAIVAVLCVFLGGAAGAEEQQQSTSRQLPDMPLMDLLQEVGRNTGRVFVVDQRVDADVVTGQAGGKGTDYGTLLSILKNNDMAAVDNGSVVSIVDVNKIRQYPLPVLYDEDPSIDDEQWVTMLVKVQHANAGKLVPILRPILPLQGHMVAHAESNTLTIVDRYGNVRRVLALVRKMDDEVVRQQQQH